VGAGGREGEHSEGDCGGDSGRPGFAGPGSGVLGARTVACWGAEELGVGL
jgi:hypothetical protein